MEDLSTNKMNKQILKLIFTSVLVSVLSVSVVSDIVCQCAQNGTNIVEQYCRSEFMVKVKIISDRRVLKNTEDELTVWYDFELVKFVKMSQGSRTALNSHKIWTVDSDCGRTFKKGKRFIITGEVVEESQQKAVTSVCKYGVQKEALNKQDEEFFRIKHAQEKCRHYPK